MNRYSSNENRFEMGNQVFKPTLFLILESFFGYVRVKPLWIVSYNSYKLANDSCSFNKRLIWEETMFLVLHWQQRDIRFGYVPEFDPTVFLCIPFLFFSSHIDQWYGLRWGPCTIQWCTAMYSYRGCAWLSEGSFLLRSLEDEGIIFKDPA